MTRSLSMLVVTILFSLLSWRVVHAEELIFQLEPTMKATVVAAKQLTVGTKLDFSAKNFKSNELLLLQRCGDPCNTAKMVRTWKQKDLADRTQSVTLNESGQYYFWIMKTLDNGEVGPVFGENVTGDASKAIVTFSSGTIVSVHVSDLGSGK